MTDRVDPTRRAGAENLFSELATPPRIRHREPVRIWHKDRVLAIAVGPLQPESRTPAPQHRPLPW